MGLFNLGGQGGLFGEGFGQRLADGFATSAAIVDGDYAAAARIRDARTRQMAERQEAEAKQQAMMGAYQALRGRGIPDAEARAMASDPGVVAEFLKGKHADKQFDAGGGSVYNPTTGGFITAPRFDSDGNIYAPGNGMTAPERLQKGTKAIPVQPGGSVVIADSITGRPDTYAGGAPQLPQQGQAGGGDLRQQAIDAIQRGADPAKVLERMKSLMGGQTGLPPSGNFPPF